MLTDFSHANQSAHSENKRDPDVHYNKNAINGIKLCLSFSRGFKFHVVYFKKCSHVYRHPNANPTLLYFI